MYIFHNYTSDKVFGMLRYFVKLRFMEINFSVKSSSNSSKERQLIEDQLTIY